MSQEFGVETHIDGVVVHTRFPWEFFNEQWQDEFIRLAQFDRDHPPAGYEFIKLYVDHINVAKGTFQPRSDFRHVAGYGGRRRP